jgi:hypothetical protein
MLVQHRPEKPQFYWPLNFDRLFIVTGCIEPDENNKNCILKSDHSTGCGSGIKMDEQPKSGWVGKYTKF